MALLGEGGEIHFKTDNRPLFDFSLGEFSACRFALSQVCYDLHAADAPWNIVTEYERTWSDKGYPIHRLVATVTAETAPAPPAAPRRGRGRSRRAPRRRRPPCRTGRPCRTGTGIPTPPDRAALRTARPAPERLHRPRRLAPGLWPCRPVLGPGPDI